VSQTTTCGCNRYGCIYCELDQAREGIRYGDIVTDLAVKVGAAWDRLARCQDEFYPEYPGACSEYHDELDTAVLELMRFADPERWNQRQAVMRAASEAAITQIYMVREGKTGWYVVAPDGSVVVGCLPDEDAARSVAFEHNKRRAAQVEQGTGDVDG